MPLRLFTKVLLPIPLTPQRLLREDLGLSHDKIKSWEQCKYNCMACIFLQSSSSLSLDIDSRVRFAVKPRTYKVFKLKFSLLDMRVPNRPQWGSSIP